MRLALLASLTALALAGAGPAVPPADAQDQARNRAGAFDYYVLALSWSPTWCALEGDAEGAGQCDPERNFGWVLHGLWPQFEAGYPEYCPTSAPDPSRRESEAMADVMGSGGLAWYQWKKHGRCTGLTGTDYYRLSRLAFQQIARPGVLDAIAQPVRLPPSVVEDAFLEANPTLAGGAITVTCAEGRIDEVRICLTRDRLAPRACGPDVARDCRLGAALLDPVR